jgi:hypothetical protein
MMRVFFACLLLLITVCNAEAQGVGDSLIVNLKNGQRVAIPLASIQKITFDSTTASGVQTTTYEPGLQVSPSFPNPLRNGTNIEFSIPTAGSVNISIFDSKGNLVRLLTMPNCASGQNQTTWDGLDEHGASVLSGAYFYEVNFNGETQTKQMVVIE